MSQLEVKVASNSLVRLATSSNELLVRSLGIAHSSLFIASGCLRLSLREVGEARWDALMQFLAFTLQNGGIMSPCCQFNSRLLGVNYPPARQRAGTHPPVKYALHSWFVPSDVAMSTHETSQMAVGGAGK